MRGVQFFVLVPIQNDERFESTWLRQRQDAEPAIRLALPQLFPLAAKSTVAPHILYVASCDSQSSRCWVPRFFSEHFSRKLDSRPRDLWAIPLPSSC